MKIDAIEPGLKINVRVEIGIDKEKHIRNLTIAVGVLSVVAALSVGFILYDKKDLISSKVKGWNIKEKLKFKRKLKKDKTK